MTEWFANILDRLCNALESIEWLFDEEKYPTLAMIEGVCFKWVFAILYRWIEKLDYTEEVK